MTSPDVDNGAVHDKSDHAHERHDDKQRHERAMATPHGDNATPRVVLDFEYYPTVRDTILSYADGEGLLQLRATSRTMRGLADALLPEHVEITAHGTARILGGSGRTLPDNWGEDTVLARWVRYADYAVTPSEYYLGTTKPARLILRRHGAGRGESREKTVYVDTPSLRLVRLRGASLLLVRVSAHDCIGITIPSDPAKYRTSRFFPLHVLGSIVVRFDLAKEAKKNKATDKCIARMRAQRFARMGQTLLADIKCLLANKAFNRKIYLVGVDAWGPLLGIPDPADVQPAIQAHVKNDTRVRFLSVDMYRRAIGKRAFALEESREDHCHKVPDAKTKARRH